jgi:hypothetical protein
MRAVAAAEKVRAPLGLKFSLKLVVLSRIGSPFTASSFRTTGERSDHLLDRELVLNMNGASL